MNEILEKLKGYESHEQLVLLASRNSIGDEEKDYIEELISLPGFNWYLFLGIAFVNRVNGVVYQNIKDIKDIPKYVKYFLKTAYFEQKKRTELHIAQIQEVEKVLQDNDIKHSFLKGAVLNTLVYEFGERISSDTDMLVSVNDLDKVVSILKEIGYSQGEVYSDVFTPATKKEILFKKLNTYEIVPLAKPVDERHFPFHELDINFRLGNDATIEESESLLMRSSIIGNENYKISSFPIEEFLLFECIHHYREAIMVYKIVRGEDLTLYKFMDIHHLLARFGSVIDWDKLLQITKEMDRIKDVYYTLYFTEILYPQSISEDILNCFKPEDVSFLDEYRGRDNTDEVYKWKKDFIHRVFSYDRQIEAMANIKDEDDRFYSIKDTLRE